MKYLSINQIQMYKMYIRKNEKRHRKYVKGKKKKMYSITIERLRNVRSQEFF